MLGEATGFLWLSFCLQLAADPELQAHDLDLFLLNPRWVHWFKKCFAQDNKCDEKDPFYIAERTRTRRPEKSATFRLFSSSRPDLIAVSSCPKRPTWTSWPPYQSRTWQCTCTNSAQ